VGGNKPSSYVGGRDEDGRQFSTRQRTVPRKPRARSETRRSGARVYRAGQPGVSGTSYGRYQSGERLVSAGGGNHVQTAKHVHVALPPAPFQHGCIGRRKT